MEKNMEDKMETAIQYAKRERYEVPLALNQDNHCTTPSDFMNLWDAKGCHIIVLFWVSEYP